MSVPAIYSPHNPPPDWRNPFQIPVGPTDTTKPQGFYYRVALGALALANDPPTIFFNETSLLRINMTGPGRIEAVDRDILANRLGDITVWIKVSYDRHGNAIEKTMDVPNSVARCILAMPDFKEFGLPQLDAIVRTPVFGPGGAIAMRPGYNPSLRTWYEPSPDIAGLPTIPDRPSRRQVSGAVSMIFDELLKNFPLRRASDRAHVLCLMLQPFIRLMISSPTPLYMIATPSPESGKGKLAITCAIPATGRVLETLPEPLTQYTMQTTITSVLPEGRSHIIFDNCNKEIAGAAWASLLTATTWSDRLLCTSKMVTAPVTATFVATANSPTYTAEMRRRTVEIRLDHGVERPDLLRLLPPLPKWALENRVHLLYSCLIICRSWIAGGMKHGMGSLGSFEAWAGVMSGLLDSIGVEGFLEDQQTGTVANDLRPWLDLVQTWIMQHGTEARYLESIRQMILSNRTLKIHFANLDVNGNEGLKRLNEAFTRQDGRIFHDHRIVGVPVEAGFKWRLEPLVSNFDPPTPEADLDRDEPPNILADAEGPPF